MFRDKLRHRAVEAGQKLIKGFKRLSSLNKEDKKLQHQRGSPESLQVQQLPSPAGTPDVMTALRVTMTIRCESPMDYSFSKTYSAGFSFQDTDDMWNGLKEHIDHSTKEIITRHDVDALEELDKVDACSKTARYHVFLGVHRRGRRWSEQHFSSFQKQPIGIGQAQELTVEADRMVARYMAHHDPSFVSELPHFVDGIDPLYHRTVTLAVNGPQDLCCVPSYFGLPGYSIEVSVRTHDNHTSRNWIRETLSRQSTPLPLAIAEALMSDASAIAQNATSELQSFFEAIHASCNGQEGSACCNHFNMGAYKLLIRIRNKLGPAYPHLSTRFKSFRILLPHDRFDPFVERLQTHVELARDRVDGVLNKMEDLKIQVHELRGKDWSIHNPLTLSFDSPASIDRDAIIKIVGRLPVGIKHELNGCNVSALVTAHKRGHLVFDAVIKDDKTSDNGQTGLVGLSKSDKSAMQTRLLNRIRSDLGMVLKNTIVPKGNCALSGLRIVTPSTTLERTISVVQSSSIPDNTPPVSHGQLRRKPKQDNLRFFIDDGRTQAKGGIRAPAKVDRILVAEEKGSTESTPSLADTDSIGVQDDDAVTPAGSPEQRSSWLASDIHSDSSQVDDDSAISDQSYTGEVTEALITTYYRVDTVAVVGTYDASCNTKSNAVASDESVDPEEDSLDLAFWDSKEGRGQVKGSLHADRETRSLTASTASTQCSVSRPTIAALYSLPNDNIALSSVYCQQYEVETYAEKIAETSASESESESSFIDGQLQRPSGRRPLLLRRIATPQLASNRSSLVSVAGHIVRRQSETWEPSPNQSQRSDYSFELGPDII